VASAPSGPTIGFHASHEQVAPSKLLEAVQLAEQVGFDAAMCSDHLAPWGERQGESGFAWAWLGAALQATELSFGVVTAPGQRFHPVIAAQAIATLGELFPGRFWAALGSGEAVNEHVTGDRWPDKPTRDARLLECVDVMRRLLRGDEVTHKGHIRVDRAKVWSRPADDQPQPQLFGAAVGPSTARIVGAWADGMITLPTPELADVIAAFEEGGGEGKPVFVQVHLSYDPDEGQALAIAHDQWRTNVFGPQLTWDLELPAQFDAAAEHVRPEAMHQHVKISSDLGRHVGWLEELLATDGVSGLYLHHVGKEQRLFLETFGSDVLPKLR
jgi:probable non-F420 flavinoid oxidoreductase